MSLFILMKEAESLQDNSVNKCRRINLLILCVNKAEQSTIFVIPECILTAYG